MSRFKEIGYELSKLWKYLTRQELCEYFGISDRTLYRYQSKLELDKTNQEVIKSNKNISIYINTPDNKVKRQTFKSWQHFVVWTKAQSHPFVITEPNVINIDYKKLTSDAKRFYQTVQ